MLGPNTHNDIIIIMNGIIMALKRSPKLKERIINYSLFIDSFLLALGNMKLLGVANSVMITLFIIEDDPGTVFLPPLMQYIF